MLLYKNKFDIYDILENFKFEKKEDLKELKFIDKLGVKVYLLYEKMEDFNTYKDSIGFIGTVRGARNKKHAVIAKYLVVDIDANEPSVYQFENDKNIVKEISMQDSDLNDSIRRLSIDDSLLDIVVEEDVAKNHYFDGISRSRFEELMQKNVNNCDDLVIYAHPFKKYLIRKNTIAKSKLEEWYIGPTNISPYNSDMNLIKCKTYQYSKTYTLTSFESLLVYFKYYSDLVEIFTAGKINNLRQRGNLLKIQACNVLQIIDKIVGKKSMVLAELFIEALIKMSRLNPGKNILESYDFNQLIKCLEESSLEDKEIMETLQHIDGTGCIIDYFKRPTFVVDSVVKGILPNGLEYSVNLLKNDIFPSNVDLYVADAKNDTIAFVYVERKQRARIIFVTKNREIYIQMDDNSVYCYEDNTFIQSCLNKSSSGNITLDYVDIESINNPVVEFLHKTNCVSLFKILSTVPIMDELIHVKEINTKIPSDYQNHKFVMQDNETIYCYTTNRLTKINVIDGIEVYSYAAGDYFKKVEFEPYYSFNITEVYLDGTYYPVTNKTLNMLSVLNKEALNEDGLLKIITIVLKAYSKEWNTLIKSYLEPLGMSISMFDETNDKSVSPGDFSRKLEKILEISLTGKKINEVVNLTSYQLIEILKMVEENMYFYNMFNLITDDIDVKSLDKKTFHKIIEMVKEVFKRSSQSERYAVEGDVYTLFLHNNRDRITDKIPDKKYKILEMVLNIHQNEKYTGIEKNYEEESGNFDYYEDVMLDRHFVDYIILVQRDELTEVNHKFSIKFKDKETFERVFQNTLGIYNFLKQQKKDEGISKARDVNKHLEFEHEDLITVLPNTPQELIQEGEELRHCVGSYIDYVSSGSKIVVFVRKKESPETPYYTVEVYNEDSRKGKIGYIEGKFRAKPTPEILEVVEIIKSKYKEKLEG